MQTISRKLFNLRFRELCHHSNVNINNNTNDNTNNNPDNSHNILPNIVDTDAGASASNMILPLTSRQSSSTGGITTQSQNIVPGLPKSVIDKIRNGEFVNFDMLLPNRAPIQTDEYTFKIVGGSAPSVALVPNTQKKPKVTDFTSWMVAWNNFLKCFTFFHPHRVQELIRYQAIICDFANQYTFSAWSTYDRMFRYQVASNLELSWSKIDDDLYNRYVRGAATLNVCFVCRGFGHFADSCPNRAGAPVPEVPQPFRAPQSFQRGQQFSQRSGQSASWSESPSIRTCFYFNNNGQCSNDRCRYAHQCRFCFGAHPGSQCPKRGAGH